ncbi:MAG TPA: T9SS type A sorting domain-containing protein [Chitinophagales bacterium]|nr:T9SS type A sorting domain-containing protein [Chitinophagales bacterium]
MKKLLTKNVIRTRFLISFTIISLASFYMANAQITLTQHNVHSFDRVLYHFDGVDPSTVWLPTEGEHQIWDYTSVVHNYNYDFEYEATPFSDPGVPDATRATQYTAALFGFLPFIVQNLDVTDATGYHNLSNHYPYQAFDISSFTGSAGDSLYFPDQIGEYKPMYTQFPATYQSSWESSSSGKIYFELSVAAFGLDHAPGYQIAHTTLGATVVGWGKLKIPYHGGSSNFIPSLLVKRWESETDSFYLYGFPADPYLLGAFGLSQGQSFTTSGYWFRRKTVDFPVVSIETDNTFSVVNEFAYDATQVQNDCGKGNSPMCIGGADVCVPVGQVQQNIDAGGYFGHCYNGERFGEQLTTYAGNEIASVYPNPSANSFSVHLVLLSEGVVTGNVYDITGHLLRHFNSVTESMQFGEEFPDGIYFMEVTADHQIQRIKIVKAQ